MLSSVQWKRKVSVGEILFHLAFILLEALVPGKSFVQLSKKSTGDMTVPSLKIARFYGSGEVQIF